MTSSIQFFASRCDIEGVLGRIEAETKVRYCRAGTTLNSDIETWESCSEIPDLGQAAFGEQNQCMHYLIVPNDAEIRNSKVSRRDGTHAYSVDQRHNPQSISLRPGGVFENALIAGQVGTVSDDHQSIELMKHIVREMKRQFAKVKSYYIGPDAMSMLDAGMRLTASTASPRAYDLCKE